MSSIQPTLSTPALDLKPTFGWIFIGVMCAAVFYGVTVSQMLFYFQTYPSDTTFLKSLVTGIWILDTLSLILISHATYTWLVIDYADPLALNNVIWTIASEPLCTATLALSVHWFMAYRIYVLKPKLMILAIAIAVMSLVPWGVGLAAVILGLTTPGGFAVVNKKLHSTAILGGVFTAVLDGIIAITLVTLLHIHGRGTPRMKRTDVMISTLTVYLITNNLLTSIITTAGAVTFFASPKTLVYEAINVTISKAYTNTFLSQLNVRESIRGRGAIVTQSSSLVFRNIKPNEINHGSRSKTTAQELSIFVAADPISSSHSGDTVQNHSSGRTFKNEKPEPL